MGCIICCTVDEERGAPPVPAYPDFAEKTHQDWGRDGGAICRDLPRLYTVFAAPPLAKTAGTTDNTASFLSTLRGGPSAFAGDSSNRPAAGVADSTSVRVKLLVLSVVGLLRAPTVVATSTMSCASTLTVAANLESSPVPPTNADWYELAQRQLQQSFSEAWDEAVREGHAVNPGSPDLSVPLGVALRRSGILNASNAMPITPCHEQQRTDVAASLSEMEHHPRVAAARILSCFAQGTVFYASQRVAHMFWFPWARHLRDNAWTVYVYLEVDETEVDDGGVRARDGSSGLLLHHAPPPSSILARRTDGSRKRGRNKTPMPRGGQSHPELSPASVTSADASPSGPPPPLPIAEGTKRVWLTMPLRSTGDSHPWSCRRIGHQRIARVGQRPPKERRLRTTRGTSVPLRLAAVGPSTHPTLPVSRPP